MTGQAAAGRAIEELDACEATLSSLDLDTRSQPLVLRNLVADWPAVQAGKRSDSAFAEMLAGLDTGAAVDVLRIPPEYEGIVGYDASMQAFNYEHYRVPITEGLKRLAAFSRHPGPVPGLAIQSAPIAECLGEFPTHHALPILDPAVAPRLWIGNRVTTPTHFDESHNVACVVCGRRRFTLFPPDQVRNLYIGPLDFAPTGTAMSLARPDRPDDPRFPRMRQALEHAMSSELAPGDAIFIPPLWWHHVASLETLNALVNYWWKPPRRDGSAPQTAHGALLHCILAFRSMGEAERKAWRTLLDHYVFDGRDAAEHIPASRRGILGPLTPETAAQLRETIKRFL